MMVQKPDARPFSMGACHDCCARIDSQDEPLKIVRSRCD